MDFQVWNLGLSQKGSGAGANLDRFLVCMKVLYWRLFIGSILQAPEVKVMICDTCKSESR